MKKDDFLKIYIEHWEKASDFLDKAILTLSTSIIWLMTVSNIKGSIIVDKYFLFQFWIYLIYITLILVLVSYIIWIYNSQLWISYFYKWADKKKITKKMDFNNKIINYFRYLYVFITILWILLLLISIL